MLGSYDSSLHLVMLGLEFLFCLFWGFLGGLLTIHYLSYID